jgi:type IV secretory pathway component VirB8
MCSQWLDSMAWDPQKQLALRLEGNIIVVVFIIVVFFIIIIIIVVVVVVVVVDWKVQIKGIKRG